MVVSGSVSKIHNGFRINPNQACDENDALTHPLIVGKQYVYARVRGLIDPTRTREEYCVVIPRCVWGNISDSVIGFGWASRMDGRDEAAQFIAEHYGRYGYETSKMPSYDTNLIPHGVKILEDNERQTFEDCVNLAVLDISCAGLS